MATNLLNNINIQQANLPILKSGPNLLNQKKVEVQSSEFEADMKKAEAKREKAIAQSKEFEVMLVSYIYNNLVFDKMKVNPLFGGGEGEKIFRSLLLEEKVKNISQEGSFGIQEQILKEILKHQEVGK